MSGPASQQTDREIQSTFGRNLKHLTKNEPSISALCRKLGINRTQFNRYLTGEASPRPLILHRICTYFDVDARILLEPLSQIKKSKIENHFRVFRDIFDGVLKPVSQSILPDGIYAQWTASLIRPGRVTFNMVRIYTENGVRKFRVRIPDPIQPVEPGIVYPQPSYPLYGLIIGQGSGFAIMDNLPTAQIASFTSYRVGYSIHPNIYPGMKMAGTSFAPNLLHSYGPCFLEKIPSTARAILKQARTPYVRDYDEVPDRVRMILGDVLKSNRNTYLNGS